MTGNSKKLKPARYQYIAATLISGVTALLGLLMLAASVVLLINGKPHAGKALGFGIFFLLLAAVRAWSILRVKKRSTDEL
jgi:predicted membrane metal-binding protein